ncbi:restriction endonuclease [Nonomuraea sp. LPB2021202275-12-8]|uniref:restriction endonuclease n=1 Tax=Nonomuraea sp. LPB2021202275-12-8 TaxID=3120159 RepID=UPI00300D454B
MNLLWPALLIAAVFALPWVLDFVRSSWLPLAASAVVLTVSLVVAAVVVRRLGAGYRREALQRAGLDRLDPKRFEELTAELLRRDGFRNVRVVGGSGDRGVDVLGTAPDGGPYAVQCKYYTRPLGPGGVRDFVGALRAPAYRDHQGVLVTSHRLSAQAAETAREQNLIVIDRDRLADWLLEVYRLGPGRSSLPWLARLQRGRMPREPLPAEEAF